MSRLQQLETALFNADKAGDTAAAQQLADAIRAERAAKASPSMASRVGSAMADTGVAAIEGIAALPDLAATALGRGGGLFARALGFNDVATALENPFTIGGSLRKAVPEQEGNAIQRGVANAAGGLLGGFGIGGALSGAGSTVAQRGVAKVLTDAPQAQFISGAAANLAASGAKALGLPVPAQVAAALVGGATPGAIDATAGVAARATAPLRQSYIREQAARILKDNVTASPDDVARRIAMATERAAISGARPTTAEVAGDSALAGFQRSLQSNTKSGALIGDRNAANAQRRMVAADRAMGPGDVTRLGDAATAGLAANAAQAAASRQRVGLLEPADVSGQSIRGLLQSSAAAAKARASKLYDVPGGDELVQIGAFRPNFIDDLPAGPSADTLARESFRREGAAFAGGTEGRVFGAAKKPGQTLIAWARSKGGINANGAGVDDLYSAGLTPKSVPGLFNSNRGSFTKGAARSNAGVTGKNVDELASMAIAEGFLPEGSTADDFAQLLTDDFNAVRGGSSRVRPGERAGFDAPVDNGRNEARNWWGREFQDRGLDPERMTADDWDAMYRDVNGIDTPAVTMNDRERIPGGGTTLSPFQASMEQLTSQYFPAGLPPASGVGALMKQLTRADTMQTNQAERIVRDLRRQSGLLKGNDNVSAGLAKAAANATEGLLSSQAGPARMEALQRARAGWRDYSSTYKEGEVGRALATNRFGVPMLDDGRVPGALVPSGRTGATAAQRLQSAVGQGPAEAAARSELRRALEVAGDDPRGVGAVADRYADTLRLYPELARDVGAAREIAALGDTFRGSPLMRVGNAGDPVSAVGMLLRAQDGGRGIKQLAGQVRNAPEAAAGLRRAIAGHIENASTGRQFDANGRRLVANSGLQEAIDDVIGKTANSDLLSREQRLVLLNVRMETKRAQFAATANRAPGSDTARNAETWGRFAAVVINGNPKTLAAKTVLDLAVSVLRRADAVRQLTVEAMLDPKLAAELLQTPTPDRVRAIANRMSGYGQGTIRAAYSAANM